MKQSFLLFLGLLTLILASQATFLSSLQHKRPRLLSSYVTKNGNITLSQDALGFTAQVDFSYDYEDASDSTNDDTARFPMAISLYTSQSFIVTNCLQFFWSNCADYDCTQYKSSANNFTLPYYSVSGYYAYNPLYLDYEYYEVDTNITVATSCSTGMGMQYGNSRYGVIGLGVNGGTSNFLNSVLFTVSANRINDTAQILFKEDTVKKQNSTFVATLQTDSNWEISSPNTTIYIGKRQVSYNTTVIFDLDSDGIGLPLVLYYKVVDWIEDTINITCNESSYAKPYCNYTGLMIDLPIIQIQIQGNLIDIPPTLYTSYVYYSEPNVYLDGFNLNFRAISPYLINTSYVTPEYANYTILDQYFLNYYFAEFSAGISANNINLYTQYSDDYSSFISPNPPTPNPTPFYSHRVVWPIILGSCLGLLIVISIICCCWRAAKRRRAAKGSSMLVENFEPLVGNHQRSDLPNQTYGQNNQGMNYTYPSQIPPVSQNPYSYLPSAQGPAIGGNIQGNNHPPNYYQTQGINN